MKNKKGMLLVISGPSGAGKGTVCKEILKKYPEFVVSISATTRAPRPTETEGQSYFYMTEEEFIKRRDKNEFIEWAVFCKNYYGTPRENVEKLIEAGHDVILEIEVQGALQVKSAFRDAILFFVVPPSPAELKRRLVYRGTETYEIIGERLKTSIWEFSHIHSYDYILLNDTAESAAERFRTIVDAERLRVERNMDFVEEFLDKTQPT